jgi:hypothetical protein
MIATSTNQKSKKGREIRTSDREVRKPRERNAKCCSDASHFTFHAKRFVDTDLRGFTPHRGGGVPVARASRPCKTVARASCPCVSWASRPRIGGVSHAETRRRRGERGAGRTEGGGLLIVPPPWNHGIPEQWVFGMDSFPISNRQLSIINPNGSPAAPLAQSNGAARCSGRPPPFHYSMIPAFQSSLAPAFRGRDNAGLL